MSKATVRQLRMETKLKTEQPKHLTRKGVLFAEILGGMIGFVILLSDGRSIPANSGMLDLLVCPALLVGPPASMFLELNGVSVVPLWMALVVAVVIVLGNSAVYGYAMHAWYSFRVPFEDSKQE